MGNIGILWNLYLRTAKAALGAAFRNASLYLVVRIKDVGKRRICIDGGLGLRPNSPNTTERADDPHRFLGWSVLAVQSREV